MVIGHQTCTWLLLDAAQNDLADDRAAWGETKYSDGKMAFRRFLCAYFGAESGCAAKGMNINPIGSLPDGAKVLKARWSRPGEGKSGGLRLVLAVYCEKRIIVVCRAYVRREAPASAEVLASAAGAPALAAEHLAKRTDR
jgi:hypothetical protein